VADLAKLPAAAAMADKVEQLERFMFLDCVRMLDKGGTNYLETLAGARAAAGPGPLRGGVVDYTPVLRACHPWYDRMAAAMRASRKDRVALNAGIERDLKALKAEATAAGSWVRSVFGGPSWRGKQIGNVLVALLMPAAGKVQGAADRTRQTHDNLRLALALEAYHRDNGAYPEKLAALAPKYMAAVPGDLFGGDLIYKREGKGYLLSSVGPDGKDDGGRTRDDVPPGDDIAVKMAGPMK